MSVNPKHCKPGAVIHWAGGRALVLDSGHTITVEQVSRVECYDHVVGFAIALNPEEGNAWIHKFVKQSDNTKEEDFIKKFNYCPECGRQL